MPALSSNHFTVETTAVGTEPPRLVEHAVRGQALANLPGTDGPVLPEQMAGEIVAAARAAVRCGVGDSAVVGVEISFGVVSDVTGQRAADYVVRVRQVCAKVAG